MAVADGTPNTGSRDRLLQLWDAVRTSFGFLSGIAMILGIGFGIALPAVDIWLKTSLPVLSFESQNSARGLLETIATSTVAVAGIAFSVTIVAFTLASSQLSPLVLRSFRRDRLSQATLAIFLGTFTYCLIVLVRLGVSGDGAEPPHLSVSVAVILALAAFLMFGAFIAHIVSMLQPSSVIAAIHGDGLETIERLYPEGPGRPEDRGAAEVHARQLTAPPPDLEVRAIGNGYLTLVDLGSLIEGARELDAVVRQWVRIGDYVLPGALLAQAWIEDADRDGRGERLIELVRASFQLGRQRTPVQDTAFAVRQLADIALKGLSPGINDPTTAQNAVEAATGVLVEHALRDEPSPVRTDSDEHPRVIALAPELDDLVRLCFDQVRVAAGSYPVVSRRLLQLLEHLEQIAKENGASTEEIVRQKRLIASGIGDAGPTDADERMVRREAAPGD